MGQRLTTVIKEKMWKVKNSAGDVEQMLPETSADQVSIADAAGKYTATDVEGALSEIATSISDLESGLASAGKVDDVRNNASDASTSIVTNKIADLSKAVVKEAGQVGHTLTIENGSHSVNFNGGTNTAVSLNAASTILLAYDDQPDAALYASRVPFGTVMTASEEMLSNADEPNVGGVVGRRMIPAKTLQPWKAEEPMLVTLLSIVTLVSLVHLEKA